MLPSCFGCADGRFAVHPCEEQRAFELLQVIRDNSIFLDDVLIAAENFLKMKFSANVTDHKYFDAFVDEQLAEIRKKFGPWLQ
jgi:hypothetical protein